MMSLSLAEARRLAISAQGLGGADRERARVNAGDLRRLVGRLGALQIDSVNVLVRSHFLPLFARLGAYDRGLLDRVVYERRELFEYWGHEASFLPQALHPVLRWRMERARDGEAWGGMVRFARDRADYIKTVHAEIAARGPLSASELSNPGASRGPWWGWADGKRALEWLFWVGDVLIAGRRNFERVYGLPEQVLSREVLETPTPRVDDAQRELVRRAARALGVATIRDLGDYFRLPIKDTRARVAELVEEGALVPAAVESWREPAFLERARSLPRQVGGHALLSPFDSLVWDRARTERLFGFHLRIELYTPAPRRRFGYYVLPFLLGDNLVARVDLKSDRAGRRLLVRGAYLEAGASARRVVPSLAAELAAMASWLGLESVHVSRRGDLAAPLRRALR
jgi:uncharacterized protein YcaQ